MKFFLRAIGYVFVVYLILSGIAQILGTKEAGDVPCKDKVEVINRQNDRRHERAWKLNDKTTAFCATYHSVEKLSLAVGQRRNNMILQVDDYENFWGSVYFNLVEDSKAYIDFIVDSLGDISNQKELSRMQLAELIVTFVQDIPYSYVLPSDCANFESGDSPCIGNIALGLLSPYEFLHSLYGDCDTRAVLIYTMLEELGFEPMIVVSDEYAHAMLALNVPSVGDHLLFKGRKYYFWETTAKGWPIGMLPPNANNINYWKIALVNES
ncbi:MAG: hypothetical protein Tsb0034_22470 [Ekhidna sp.]